MAVYVNRPLFRTLKGNWCYLAADTLDELNTFAARLKLKREWIKMLPAPHYDISVYEREIALNMGAQVVIGGPESVRAQIREAALGNKK